MSDDAHVAQAVEALKAGKPVIFPTDTVYGVGVSVLHAESPHAIYDVKRRQAGKPVAWLVSDASALELYGQDVPAYALELAERHWPGALTIIVKASSKVPMAFRSQEGTIGLRMPASDTALSLIRAVGCPVATSSANTSGQPAPRLASEISPEVLQRVSAVVKDDALRSGVASTVIDCSHGAIEVVRQGDVALGQGKV